METIVIKMFLMSLLSQNYNTNGNNNYVFSRVFTL